MNRVGASDYGRYLEAAKGCRANRIYPSSIALGYQTGDIFTWPCGTVLFWHYCGFGYLSGPVGDGVLDDIWENLFMKETPRRFVLITEDKSVADCMLAKGGLAFSMRCEYVFPEGMAVEVPETPYRVERINAENIGKINGRIVPAFSWDSDEAFLKRGFGYAAFDGDEFCAVAFSSAVSDSEVDIGVETAENYRRKGLASLLSQTMLKDIEASGKRAVWAHAAFNPGSARTALSCGFVKTGENYFLKKD